MAFNFDKVQFTPHHHVIIRASEPGCAINDYHNIYGFTVYEAAKCVAVLMLAGDYQWKYRLSLPREHARALAYLLLFETAGPLERAAVIADARAEGIEIGGITSAT